jgi:type IV secretion system protein VirD4
MGNRNNTPGAGRSSAFTAARMVYRYPWKVGASGLACVWVGAGAQHFGLHDPALFLIPGGLAAYTGATSWWWLKHVARPHTTEALIARRAELDQRAQGVATHLDIAEHASPKALRLKAHILRPSLAGLSRRERARLDPRQVGVQVARLGLGWWGEQIWSTCEDATHRIGGPRTGKTLSLADHGQDAPGALITTSTRLDLAKMLQQARTVRGAVHIFNPAGLGGLASTVRWRVLSGCEDFATAQRRATDLIPESTGEGERWDQQARRVLPLFLHAAAVTGRDMRDVMRWVYDNTPTSRDEVVDALLSVEVGGRDRAAAARAFYATNDRTRTSITTTMSTPLAWMADDRARLLGDAPADDPALVDVTKLIERGETLHLIGHEDQGGLSPLIGALVAEIAHAARTLASHRPSGRLDPPLTMLLDEAALVCPVPIDRWSADMGGRGVTLHVSVQSLAQLRQRWGSEGAAAILANVATFVVFGGSPSADDLRDLSLLTGEHRMKVVGPDHRDDSSDGERRGEYRWVPVLSPAQIRALGPGQVLVMRRGLPIAVGWAPLVTQRKGWVPVPLLTDTTTTDGRQVGVPSTVELEAMLDDTTPTQPTEPSRGRGSVPRPSRTGSRGGQPRTVVEMRSESVRSARPAAAVAPWWLRW